MILKNQAPSKNVIPCLNKDIISKMDVSNFNGTTNKSKNDNNKSGLFSTIPTGFMNGGNY